MRHFFCAEDLSTRHLSDVDGKALQTLNWEAIKKSGKYRFQITVSEKPITRLLDLSEVLN